MYIYDKTELIEHPMLNQVVALSEMTAQVNWRSIYMDKQGELSVSFYGQLSKGQIKTILMHFKDLLDGDTDVNNISCQYGFDYTYSSDDNVLKEFTQVFTPDGYDYSQF